MADARAQVLPMVGGGEHDWFNILYSWHMLYYDTRLTAFMRIAGWAGMAAAWCWLVWQGHLGMIVKSGRGWTKPALVKTA